MNNFEENYEELQTPIKANYDDFDKDLNRNTEDLSMRLPIKNHINKLESLLNEILTDLEDSRKSIQIMRSEFVGLEHLHTENCGELAKQILDSSIRIGRDLRKISLTEEEETNFLKTQITGLVQDKIKLQQQTLVLENRVCENEKDVGFKGIYDFA